MSERRKRDTFGMVHRPGCALPDVRVLCECGANVVCRTCRWGRGAWPCKCDKERVRRA